MELVIAQASRFNPLEAKFDEHWWSEIDTDSRFMLLHRNSRVHLHFTELGLQTRPAMQEEYLHFIKVADAWGPDGLATEDFYDWIVEVCGEELSRLMPLRQLSANPSLED
jgi:hypothetical protein